MGGVPCAAKILLCSPPVANRVSNVTAQACAVASSVLDYGSPVTPEHLTELQEAVCRCELLAEQIEKELRGPLQACMNDIYSCPVSYASSEMTP